MITRRLRVCGKVQGVGYRDALRFEAQRRGIAGWVRNRADGSVEALLQGPGERVEELIAWARHGPSAARVDELRIDVPDEGLAYAAFERRPTV